MIKVEIDDLKQELQNLSSAMADFEPYSKSFINDTVSELDAFNSDFISEIKSTMKNMTDTKAPKLMENLQDFYTSLDTVLRDFEKTDKSIADGTKREER